MVFCSNEATYSIVDLHSGRRASVSVVELGQEVCECYMHGRLCPYPFVQHRSCTNYLISDGFIICDVLECGFAPTPIRAQHGFVLDENVLMTASQKSRTIRLTVTQVGNPFERFWQAKL